MNFYFFPQHLLPLRKKAWTQQHSLIIKSLVSVPLLASCGMYTSCAPPAVCMSGQFVYIARGVVWSIAADTHTSCFRTYLCIRTSPCLLNVSHFRAPERVLHSRCSVWSSGRHVYANISGPQLLADICWQNVRRSNCCVSHWNHQGYGVYERFTSDYERSRYIA